MLTNSALDAPKDLKGVFEVVAFRNNFVNNYLKTTGRPDGEMIFEREKLMFLKAVNDNTKLQECTRFSIYSAFIELAASGLTLSEGCCYILPYGKQAQFQIGYKGRLEQINSIPGVELAPEPQVVWSGDDFDYELGSDPRIIKHKPIKAADRAKDALIEYVYLVLTLDGGRKRLTIMDRATVIARRDRYSKSYIYYVKNDGKYSDGKPMDKPFWLTNEEKAFKKTVVKEAYSFLPKTARMKALDERIQYNLDPETGELKDGGEKIDLGMKDDDTINTTHEDVTEKHNAPENKTTPDLGDINKEF